jgi:putative acetyltransferase
VAQDFIIRPIEKRDEAILAAVVRKVMVEYNGDPKTTILGDPTLDTMYSNYQEQGASYYIAELAGKLVGGAGVRKLDGGEPGICELQRMFLLPEARGLGIGKTLMDKCLADAKKFGYKSVYIETLPHMDEARKLYEKSGFHYIENRMGNTGHVGCGIFMIKSMTNNH